MRISIGFSTNKNYIILFVIDYEYCTIKEKNISLVFIYLKQTD